MQRGNPYHDARGRFTSASGACRTSDETIRELAESEAERWQEDNSEIEPDGYDYGQPYLRDGGGGYADYDAAMEEELEAKADEYEDEIRSVCDEYTNRMSEKVKGMDYETLKDFAEHPDKYDREVVSEISHDFSDAVTDCAAEDFANGNSVDLRYRRIVAKCNGKHKLFAMAMDEGEYGLNGYAENYATQKIGERGLQEDFENYKLAKEAYARGDQALGKAPDEYKNEKAYIMAKMKHYKQIDKERNNAQYQYDLIQAKNPMADDYHTGIRSPEDIKSFDEAMSDGDFYNSDASPDFTASDANRAKRDGLITIYSSKPIDVGTFVTPSRMEAQNYAGNGRIYSATVGIEDVAWIDGIEGQYATDNVPF